MAERDKEKSQEIGSHTKEARVNSNMSQADWAIDNRPKRDRAIQLVF